MKRGLVVLDPAETPPDELAGRVTALQARLRAEGLDAALIYGDVSRSDDIAYLTNLCLYWNEAVLVVGAEGEPTLATKLSKRVHPWMRKTTTLRDIRSGRDLAALAAAALVEREAAGTPQPGGAADVAGGAAGAAAPLRVGLVEADWWPATLVAELGAALAGAELVELGGTVREARAVLSDGEAALLRRAEEILGAAVADAAAAPADPRARVAQIERAVRGAGFADLEVRCDDPASIDAFGQYRNLWVRVTREAGAHTPPGGVRDSVASPAANSPTADTPGGAAAPNAAGAASAPAASAERDHRFARLRAAIDGAGLDGLLAYAPAWRRENVRYLTAAPLRSSAALVHLPAEGEPVAYVDDPHDAQAIRAAGFVADVRPLARLEAPPGRLGVAHLELLPLSLQRRLAHARIESATALMDRVRMVKSDWELARMRRCGELCDAGWRTLLDALRPGVAEYELVAEVEASLKAAGAEDNFMLIASGGADVRGMTPPSRRRLQPGDMVRSELTPQWQGYWTQICRTAVVGEASQAQRDSFALFEEATSAGIARLAPGVTAHEVACAENDVFRAHGFGEYCTSEYTRVRGHGHGLHLDEVAIIEGNDTVIAEGAVLIVHPNTFTPIAGYHVLGDPVVVTSKGAEPLLRTPRELDQRPV